MNGTDKKNMTIITEDTIVMCDEPLKDVSIEKIREMAENIKSTKELVALYAAVDNKAAYIIDDEFDYAEGSTERKQVENNINDWWKFEDELLERIVVVAQHEHLFKPKEPNSGLVRQISPLMEKYGYRNANGWWIEIE